MFQIKIVYIVGPYNSSDGYEGIEKNIKQAERCAIGLANNGIGFICPHLNTKHFEIKSNVDESFYYEMGLKILSMCDAVIVLPGWKNSVGSKKEISLAISHNIPVFYNINELIKHEL